MYIDDDIPEFMKHYHGLCNEEGCINRVLRGSDKCLDCIWEASLPKLRDEIDILLVGT
jgi:hypothetical protein